MLYNSEIWHLPTIKSSLKQKILSASARALKVCSKSMTDGISFINLHKMYGRATPDQMMNYKMALSLFRIYNIYIFFFLRIYNCNFNLIEFVALNFNQIFTSRQMNFITTNNNRTKVGLNCLANRPYYINGQIHLTWLNLSYTTYKVKCKNIFLKWYCIVSSVSLKNHMTRTIIKTAANFCFCNLLF